MNGIGRMIQLPRYTSFEKLVAEVRSKLDNTNAPLNLKYYTGFTPKTLKRGLDNADEWEQLLTLVYTNRKKVKEGEYHARLVHFVDENKKVKGKGGQTAAATGSKVRFLHLAASVFLLTKTQDGKGDTILSRIINIHGCKTEHKGRQCYEITEDDRLPDSVGKHVEIPVEMQFLWAEDCVSKSCRSRCLSNCL